MYAIIKDRSSLFPSAKSFAEQGSRVLSGQNTRKKRKFSQSGGILVAVKLLYKSAQFRPSLEGLGAVFLPFFLLNLCVFKCHE